VCLAAGQIHHQPSPSPTCVPDRRVLFANVVDPMPLNLPFRDDLELLLRLNNSDIRDGLWMFMALGLPHYNSYGKAMAVDYISRLTR
jgi:hypothetical protein